MQALLRFSFGSRREDGRSLGVSQQTALRARTSFWQAVANTVTAEAQKGKMGV